MNISATYSIPAGRLNPIIQDTSHTFPDNTQNTDKWLPVPIETPVSGINAHSYYVVEENIETIYTDKKTTQIFYHNSGALIDIYA